MPKIITSFLLVLLALSQGVLAESYVYVDALSNKEGLRIEEGSRYIVFRGHVGLEWVKCESDGVCLASSGLVISLPSSVDGKWMAAGVEFDGIHLGKVFLLGQELGEGYRISSFQGEVAYQFIYTKNYGLVAIFASAKNQESTFLISQSRCAFGAAPMCKSGSHDPR